MKRALAEMANTCRYCRGQKVVTVTVLKDGKPTKKEVVCPCCGGKGQGFATK